MQSIFTELNEDHETRTDFFKTIFEKMHLDHFNIKSETFYQAEKNIELLKNILDFDGAASVFVNSSHFYNSTMNGQQIQKHSYLGRYFSFSAIVTETNSWRQSDMNSQFHK